MARLDGRPSRAALSALLCALCVGACSDEGAGETGGGGAGGLDAMNGGGSSGSSGAGGRGASGGNGSGGTAGGVSTAGTGSGDAGSASNAGMGGRGAGGSSAGGSGAEPTPESLFPLAVGNRWTYDVTTPRPDTSPCAAGEHSTEIVASSTVDGRTAFEAKHVCDALNPDAVRFYAHSDVGMESKRCPSGAAACEGSWTIGLPRPIVEQATFQASDGPRTLHRVGRVTVPAGTFEECWETRGEPPSPLVSVYCPGVGPVAFSQMDETSPPLVDYTLELISFDVQ